VTVLGLRGVNIWVPTLIAVAIGYTLRVTALYRGWEEPLAAQPAGVYKHDDGRPLLGRKLAGKSQRELRDLGLLVEDTEPIAPGPDREDPSPGRGAVGSG
jgi:hypothetical protein